MICWNVTREEHKIIQEIAERAYGIALDAGMHYPLYEIVMDLTATHANGCPLRLSELAAAPKFDFVHDVFGIREHINRKDGTLLHCFLPRFAELSAA